MAVICLDDDDDGVQAKHFKPDGRLREGLFASNHHSHHVITIFTFFVL